MGSLEKTLSPDRTLAAFTLSHIGRDYQEAVTDASGNPIAGYGNKAVTWQRAFESYYARKLRPKDSGRQGGLESAVTIDANQLQLDAYQVKKDMTVGRYIEILATTKTVPEEAYACFKHKEYAAILSKNFSDLFEDLGKKIKEDKANSNERELFRRLSTLHQAVDYALKEPIRQEAMKQAQRYGNLKDKKRFSSVPKDQELYREHIEIEDVERKLVERKNKHESPGRAAFDPTYN